MSADTSELKADAGSLRWFGAWKRTSWKLGEKREAYASGRGGRYRILREPEAFVVGWCPPYKCPDQPGTAVTQEEAIALAQAHKDRGRRRWVAEWLNAGCRVLGG